MKIRRAPAQAKTVALSALGYTQPFQFPTGDTVFIKLYEVPTQALVQAPEQHIHACLVTDLQKGGIVTLDNRYPVVPLDAELVIQGPLA